MLQLLAQAEISAESAEWIVYLVKVFGVPFTSLLVCIKYFGPSIKGWLESQTAANNVQVEAVQAMIATNNAHAAGHGLTHSKLDATHDVLLDVHGNIKEMRVNWPTNWTNGGK